MEQETPVRVARKKSTGLRGTLDTGECSGGKESRWGLWDPKDPGGDCGGAKRPRG